VANDYINKLAVALVNPQIPQNTGSIARTCAATKTPLHLIGQLGFEVSEKNVRRAGLDYWPYVKLSQHEDWDSFCSSERPKRIVPCSTKGATVHHDFSFKEGDVLTFGSETTGLGEKFLSKFNPEEIIRIPMDQIEVRSLNLSNAVSIVLYEARRQLEVKGRTELT